MNAETTVLDVQEALVIHPGDTIVLRVGVDHRYTHEQIHNFRKGLLERLGDRVADVVIVCADGLYVIRPASPEPITVDSQDDPRLHSFDNRHPNLDDL